MNDNFYAVIMAGGGGTRLWPISTRDHPKQMLKLAGERTMFQLTLDRLKGVIDSDHILVVSTAEQTDKLKAQTDIPAGNFLIEPLPKGTASVVGLAAVYLLRKNPNAVMAVLPADHYIQNVPLFHELLRNGYDAANRSHLVTMGIKPTFPSSGMGYIEFGDRLPSDYPLLRVKRFHEKPDKETAEAFLAKGNFYWNSGMFIWRADQIRKDIARFLPELTISLDQIHGSADEAEFQQNIQNVWPILVQASVDVGVMEKSDDVVVLPAEDLAWNDIGSWESLFDVMPADDQGVIVLNGQSYALDSKGSLTSSADSQKMVVLIGMEDTVVVETDKAILVCKKSDSQRVREVVDYLRKNQLNSYL